MAEPVEQDDWQRPDSSRQEHAAQPKSHRAQCVFLLTIVSFTALICGAVLYGKRHHAHVPNQVTNEQRILDEVDRLQAQGMAAYKEWSEARRDGDSAREKKTHTEALESFSAAMDTLNRLLDRYRDADGMLLPDYEGYEDQLSEISIRLGDLLRGARVDARGH